MEAKIEKSGTIARVYAPYNQDFIKAIKEIRGTKWSASNKCWDIPIAAIPSVREIMTNICGFNDLTIGSYERINLRIYLPNGLASDEYCSDVIFCGKTLSHASGRDSCGIPGEGVFYVKGCGSSGGSRNQWFSFVEEGSVIDLVDVPKVLYDKYLQHPRSEIIIQSVTDENQHHEPEHAKPVSSTTIYPFDNNTEFNSIDFVKMAKTSKEANATLDKILNKQYYNFDQYAEVNKITDLDVAKLIIKRMLDMIQNKQ